MCTIGYRILIQQNNPDILTKFPTLCIATGEVSLGSALSLARPRADLPILHSESYQMGCVSQSSYGLSKHYKQTPLYHILNKKRPAMPGDTCIYQYTNHFAGLRKSFEEHASSHHQSLLHPKITLNEVANVQYTPRRVPEGRSARAV